MLRGQESSDVVTSLLTQRFGALTASETQTILRELPIEHWANLIATTQAQLNTLAAIQSLAIAHLAAIASVQDGDGTWSNQHRGLGHESLDAPAVIADLIGTSTHVAARRTRHAITAVATTPALLTAMANGELDAYRAGVISDQLTEADPVFAVDVVDTVLDKVGDHLSETPPSVLRRQTRTALAKVDPEVLRRKAETAHQHRYLTHYPNLDTPTMDTWDACLPVEQARTAWACIDELARSYRANGQCGTLEQARADALVDLITGHATISAHITLTVPATEPEGRTGETTRAKNAPSTATPAAEPAAMANVVTGSVATEGPAGHGDVAEDLLDALVTVNGLDSVDPALVSRTWLGSLLTDPATTIEYRACDPGTGTLQPPRGCRVSQTYRPSPKTIAYVEQRDGRCRFPGCRVKARYCDVDHVNPWPTGPTAPENLACLCRHHHRSKQLHRWRARLDPATAVMTWTTPTGRTLVTAPADHLTLPVISGCPKTVTPPFTCSFPISPALREKHRAQRRAERDPGYSLAETCCQYDIDRR